jgi:hypothetical protein
MIFLSRRYLREKDLHFKYISPMNPKEAPEPRDIKLEASQQFLNQLLQPSRELLVASSIAASNCNRLTNLCCGSQDPLGYDTPEASSTEQMFINIGLNEYRGVDLHKCLRTWIPRTYVGCDSKPKARKTNQVLRLGKPIKFS